MCTIRDETFFRHCPFSEADNVETNTTKHSSVRVDKMPFVEDISFSHKPPNPSVVVSRKKRKVGALRR